MASHKIIEQSLNMGGKVVYLMELDSEEGVQLTYPTAQTQETLDEACDRLLAEKNAKIALQAKIDEATAAATKDFYMTDEERENLG
tara:strand:+ start:1124 stop:1381 length:258 start_codon:yes stop_codon:yes gene_type:complete